ncbi:MAG: hypothetical protein A2041_14080, partial [Bacteroidetes bacterium GWA2_31_9b]
KPPAEGKAVVYFTRITKYGFAMSLDYFNNDKFIGAFKGQNYMRFECEPGEQIFWLYYPKKIDLIKANLKPGDSYVVIVDVRPDKSQLTPISIEKEMEFNRAKDLINKSKPVIFKESDIEKMNVKLSKRISETMNIYETQLKNESAILEIKPEMAIPEESKK